MSEDRQFAVGRSGTGTKLHDIWRWSPKHKWQTRCSAEHYSNLRFPSAVYVVYAADEPTCKRCLQLRAERGTLRDALETER